jgi:hypothetical protein
VGGVGSTGGEVVLGGAVVVGPPMVGTVDDGTGAVVVVEVEVGTAVVGIEVEVEVVEVDVDVEVEVDVEVVDVEVVEVDVEVEDGIEVDVDVDVVEVDVVEVEVEDGIVVELVVVVVLVVGGGETSPRITAAPAGCAFVRGAARMIEPKPATVPCSAAAVPAPTMTVSPVETKADEGTWRTPAPAATASLSTVPSAGAAMIGASVGWTRVSGSSRVTLSPEMEATPTCSAVGVQGLMITSVASEAASAVVVSTGTEV